MLKAYRLGLFPMAETRTAQRLYWLDPAERGILPLDGFHVSRTLRRTLRSVGSGAGALSVTADADFAAVIAGCAASGSGREDTWINPDIERLFTALAEAGHAHSVETWRDGVLVGGLYGVAIGGAFFGESMFSRATDASKVALVHLVARLRLGGFRLLDTQFVTTHLARFGAIEVPRERYKSLLRDAVDASARWIPSPDGDLLAAEIAGLGSEGD